MVKMKVIKADGTVTIVEDESYKKPYYVPKRFDKISERAQMIQLIIDALKKENGQTIHELLDATKIPEYLLERYLLTLERDTQIKRVNKKLYLNNT